MPLCLSLAATDESTPPEMPPKTRPRNDLESLWHFGQLVPVAHPHEHLIRLDVGKEGVHLLVARLDYIDGSLSILSSITRVYFAAVLPPNLLQPVADAQDGHVELEDVWHDARRCVIIL